MAEGVKDTLGMEIEEVGEMNSAGEKGFYVTKMALGAIELLANDENLSGSMLIDACNGFNNMIPLAMLWTVQHCWMAGVRFVFNCYRHWAQLLIRQPGELQVTILIQEGVTQGYPLSMVLNRITIFPLAKEFRAAYTGMLYLFYVDDAAFDGLAQHSAQLLKLLWRGRRTGDISLNRIIPSSFQTHRGRRSQRRRNLRQRG